VALVSGRLRALLIAAGAGVVLVALVLSLLVSGGDERRPSAPTTDAPTSSAAPTEPPAVLLGDIDTQTLAVTRDTFCADVSPEAVETALGGPPTGTREYGDGDRVQVTGRVRDIAHEFGCTWTTSTTNARAWVFAPPVTRRGAADLVRAARRESGCRAVPSAAAFGSPSIALRCRTSRGVQASYRGLFGDAWVTCAVADRRATSSGDVVDRAERWCVAVLAATAP
jgi:hypothetical protein